MGLRIDVHLEDIDLGFDAIHTSLKRSNNTRVEAGLFRRKLAQRGVWNEFGTSKVPARPWLSVAADTGIPKIAKAAKKAARAVADGGSAKAAFEPVGQTMAKLAQDVIRKQRVGGPPLATSTRRRKGHGRKLEDTKEMLGGITYKVRARN